MCFLSASFAILVCSLILPSTGFALEDTVYVDPQQHFTIQVPDGWVDKPYSTSGVSGVTIVHGADAYVQIFLQKGIDPTTFIKALSSGIETTHPGYHVMDRGMLTASGPPRMFIIGESPETPTAPRTRVYLQTFAANGFSYAIIASSSGRNAPAKDLMVDYKVTQKMIQSLTLNAVPAQASIAVAAILATAPSPAGSDAPATGNVPVALSRKGQKKLAALDAAFKGGALSEEEYQTKKTALYSRDLLQQRNSALLKALNQAYEDGVLTKEEFDRKKAQLATDIPPPATSPDPIPVPGTPPVKPVEASVAKSDPQAEPLPKSWITHKDPSGFEVNLPATWTVDKISSTGKVILRGTQGEEIMIWQLHLQQPELEAQDATATVQELARKFDALMPWSEVQLMPNVARVLGLGAERSATALLSWTSAPSTPSVYFYGIEAPGDVYRNSTDSFVAILKSFHVVQESFGKDVMGIVNGPGAGEPKFVNWIDPHDGAFSVSVPQNWRVIGGGYRLSVEDVRYSVVLSSPDGQVRASMGDSMVGPFTQPTETLAATGLSEGAFQTLGDGTRLEILRYNSGQQFAQSYVETLVSRQCNDPRIESSTAREDLAATFSQSAANEGFTDEILTSGEVSFTCSLEGRPAKGKYVAATIRMAPGFSPVWFVYRLYGYIAFVGREPDGEKVLAQMLQSTKFNQGWEARQKGNATPPMQRDDERSQQIRERAQQNIAEDQRQISEMITNANEQVRKFYAQADRKRENSTVGKLDIADPQSGTQNKVSGFGIRYTDRNDGYLKGAKPSGPNLREMIALPQGN
jgi:hypothetical protein